MLEIAADLPDIPSVSESSSDQECKGLMTFLLFSAYYIKVKKKIKIYIFNLCIIVNGKNNNLHNL
jgi:hypothetical protein